MLADLVEAGGQDPATVIARAPLLPGTQQTLGQALGNQAIRTLEKEAFGSPVGQSYYRAFRAANSAALRAAAETLVARVAPEALPELSVNIATDLEEAKDATDAQEDALWDAVDPSGTVKISRSAIDAVHQQAISDMWPIEETSIPAEFSRAYAALPDGPVALNHYQQLRSVVGKMVAMYLTVLDQRRSGAAKCLYKALSTHLENLTPADLTNTDDAEGVLSRLRAARDFSRAKDEIFWQNPLREIFRVDWTGAKRGQPEAIAHRVLNPYRPEGVRQAIAALRLSGGEPADLQNYLVSDWLYHAQMGEFDPGGYPILSGVKLRKFLSANRQLFDALFSTDTAKATTQAIVDAAERADSVQRFTGTGGLPIAMIFKSGRLVNELMRHVYHPTSWGPGMTNLLLEALRNPDIGVDLIRRARRRRR